MTKKVKTYAEVDDYYDPYFMPLAITPNTGVTSVNDKNNRTLQVSANPSELTDSEVVNYFTQSGPIEEVTIPFDKTKNKWKGFLYIVFESVTIVEELIKTPTKMINGKKVLVAKTATANNNNLNNIGLNLGNFATVNVPPTFSNLTNIAMFSTSPIPSATASSQSPEVAAFAPIPLPTDFMIPAFSTIPMPPGYSFAMPSDIAGPSGLGGNQ